MADSQLQRSCCCHPSHSSLHCLPHDNPALNLASNSPCQELQSFWVPTFYSSLKRATFSCMSREGSGSDWEWRHLEVGPVEARSEPPLSTFTPLPIILPLLARAPPLYPKPLYLPRPFSGASFRPSLVSSLESVYPSSEPHSTFVFACRRQ